jgi:hypothetical protein
MTGIPSFPSRLNDTRWLFDEASPEVSGRETSGARSGEQLMIHDHNAASGPWRFEHLEARTLLAVDPALMALMFHHRAPARATDSVMVARPNVRRGTSASEAILAHTVGKFSAGAGGCSATAVGDLAIFAGFDLGIMGGPTNEVAIYNGKTKRWSSAFLSESRRYLAATSVGGLAMFAGGLAGFSQPASNIVDVYNVRTGRWYASPALSQARWSLAATSVGNLAIFAGGGNAVDIYNAVTGKWSTATLSQGRSDLAATTVGNLAMFAGGYTGGGVSNVVDIYDASNGQWSTGAIAGTSSARGHNRGAPCDIRRRLRQQCRKRCCGHL